MPEISYMLLLTNLVFLRKLKKLLVCEIDPARVEIMKISVVLKFTLVSDILNNITNACSNGSSYMHGYYVFL